MGIDDPSTPRLPRADLTLPPAPPAPPSSNSNLAVALLSNLLGTLQALVHDLQKKLVPLQSNPQFQILFEQNSP